MGDQLGLLAQDWPANLAVQSEGPPRISLGSPGWLLLLPVLLAGSWWIARRALGGWRGGRQYLALALRGLLIAVLTVTLAEPRINRVSPDVSVVVVRDVSASVPADQQRAADDFLSASAAGKRPGDLLGVVTTAKEAFVQSIPATEPRLDLGPVGDPGETDLQQGLQLARAVAPPGAGLRLLLMSDGNQTKGGLEAAVGAAAAARVPIDVVTVDYDRSGMIRVVDVAAPAWARAGDTVLARVVVDSGRSTPARLSFMVNGAPLDLDPESAGLSESIELVPGLNRFSIPVRLSDNPVQQFEAIVEPADGRSAVDVPSLLRYESLTFTGSRGRVLVISDDAAGVEPLREALRSDEFSLEMRPTASAPASAAEWAGYDAVVLANTPAYAFSQVQQRQLAQYVRDAGGGLVVLGGPDSYGAGGWIGSPLAEALPVEVDPPQKRNMPKGALAIIIDRSGSMSAPVGATGMSQQQLANDAAILAVRALSRLDQVTVVAFSEDSEVVVPMTAVGDPDGIARRIRTIGSGGGTNLFPAIDAAAVQLARANAGVRHLIILSDGQTAGDPAEGLAKAAALKAQGITLSTVAIGDAANDGLLQEMAARGGGRSYPVTGAAGLARLPQIFIKEAQTVRRTLIWEGTPFSPTASAAAETLATIRPPFPAVSGYVVTGERGGLASVSLRGPGGDPLLAHWQHGLGRVTAYMSDAGTRWNAAWPGWPGFSAFWKRQLSWAMRPGGDPRARVTVQRDGARARLSVDLLDEGGERANFATIEGRVLHPDQADAAGSAADVLRMQQVGPGRYEAEVPADAPGVHLVSLRYAMTTPAGPRQGSLRAAVVKRDDDELRQPRPDVQAMWRAASQTNGRIFRLGPEGADLWTRDDLVMPVSSRPLWLVLALAGVGLLLVDVAARRIAVDPARVRAAAAGLWSAGPAKTAGSLTTLATAKARAGKAIREQTAVAVEAERGRAAATPEPRGRAVSAAPGPVLTKGAADQKASPTAASDAAANERRPSAPGSVSSRQAGADEPADAMARLRAAKNRARGEEPGSRT